jgi:hypothetical protein
MGLLAASALVLGGCGKSQEQQQGPPPMTINGVKVDVPKLQLLTADKPELLDGVNKTMMAIRYGKYDEALAELDKLAAAASLTDPQKKLVNDVIEQVKQVAAKAAAK